MLKEHPTFAAVRDWIARFERRSLLEQIARLGTEISSNTVAEVVRSDGRSIQIGHHFLARIALVSAVYGRDHGREASRDAVIDACVLWGEMHDPFLEVGDDAELKDLNEFVIRTSWDQFPVQERAQDNMRIWFGIYRRARWASVLGEDFNELWEQTFGLSLEEWYRGGLVYWLLAIVPSLPPGAAGLPLGTRGIGIAPIVSTGELRVRAKALGTPAACMEVAVRDLSQNYDELKSRYGATRPDDENFERYAVNPLVSRPILRLNGTHFVLPVARLFGNALGLATLYRLMETEGAFAAKFGRAFEHYVGETLRSSFTNVLPEETYRVGRDEWSGFDWTVLDPEFSLVVECRTSRIPAGAKTTGDVASIVDGLKRAVSEPAAKMPDKIDHIGRGFTKTPTDIINRPIHRLIVTAENMHLEATYAELAGYDPCVPESPIVVSIADLQRLLSVEGRTIHELIEEYRSEYEPRKSGSLGQWLRAHPEYSKRIGQHPVLREDREILLPRTSDLEALPVKG